MKLKILKKPSLKSRRTLFSTVLLLALVGLLLYHFLIAHAFTGNNGTFFYAGNNFPGRIFSRTYTYSSTVGAAFNTTQQETGAASADQFIVSKAAPTRNSMMIGRYSSNGYLDVDICNNGGSGTCQSSSNFVSQWYSQILGTNVVHRAFDIAYEQLSGRAMVVYAGNTTGRVYYCIWDGTNWGPVSGCAPTNGTNDIQLTDGTNTLSGTPAWVRLIAPGTQFGDYRTNQLLLAVEDTNSNLFLDSWNGSSWVSADRLAMTSTSLTQNSSQPYDIGWESLSGMEMVAYASGTSIYYRTSTGSGWGSQTSLTSLGSSNNALWVKLAADSHSNRLSAVAVYGSSSPTTVVQYIWKTDGSTVGWTAGTSYSSGAQATGQVIATAWLKANGGTPKALFTASESGSNKHYYIAYNSWTQSGGFTSWTLTADTQSKNANDQNLVPSPNSDIALDMTDDISCHVYGRTFSGSAWNTLLSTTITSNGTTSTSGCVTSTYHAQNALDFTYIPYSAWSLNWQVFKDYSDATPNQSLAAEDTEADIKPNLTFRLRMNVAELGGGYYSGVRKKLQYSSGSGCPNSTSCVWTDVGEIASGSIWRYASGALSDDTTIPTTLLDGSTTTGQAYTSGISASVDAPAAGSVEEYDYTLQNNGATLDTPYYFRMYDYGPSISGGSNTNLNAIFREQILNTAGTEQTNCTNGSASQTCTYPTLLPHQPSPQAPHFYFPLNGDTNVPLQPVIQLKSADPDDDYIQYEFEYCPTNSWPCPSGGGTFDQTASQTNWYNQDADSGQAYAGNSVEVVSSMGEYSLPGGNFKPNTTYYLRGEAKAPAGSTSFSPYSSVISFTTGTLDILISGGTNLTGNLFLGNNFGRTSILDNFNRANSTGLGSNWGTVSSFGDFNVNANESHDPSGTTFAFDYWNHSTFGPNAEAYATVINIGSDFPQICVRLDPTNKNGYCVNFTTAGAFGFHGLLISKLSAGSFTTLADQSGNQTVSAGDKIGISVSGSTITGWYYTTANGTWVPLVQTSDSTYSSANYIGMYSRSDDLDDFGGGNITY